MGNVRVTQTSKMIVGVAYPSRHYGYDFGDTAEGLHNANRIQQVNRDFAELSRNGVHLVRMNVFTDGRTGSGIIFDNKGNPTGIQPTTLDALRNVLLAAKNNDIQLTFVMLDHTFAFREERISSSERKQGHGALLQKESSRRQLLNAVLLPVLNEIGKNPSNVLSVEFINEPESIIDGMKPDPDVPVPDRISQQELPAFKQFLRDFRDLVHANGAQFTIGSLALPYASNWLDVLDPVQDYLSIHYYGQNGEPAYADLYNSADLKALQASLPVIWGEYAANGSAEVRKGGSPQQFSGAEVFLKDAREGHIKGAIGWSMYDGYGKSGDFYGRPPLAIYRKFTAEHSHHIEFAGGKAPVLPRNDVLENLKDLLFRDTGSSTIRPKGGLRLQSPPIIKLDPFDPRNPWSPNNPLNIQKQLQNQLAALDKMRKLKASMASEAAKLRRKTPHAASIVIPAQIGPGAKSGLRGSGTGNFTRPPFGPSNRGPAGFGGPPVTPSNPPHKKFHPPTWRDYHRFPKRDDPFGVGGPVNMMLPPYTYRLPRREHRIREYRWNFGRGYDPRVPIV